MLVRIAALPDEPIAAAAAFHAGELPEIEALFDPPKPEHDVLIVFPPADHRHRAWRLAAVQSLARAHAPIRVNALASDDEPAIAAACTYLASAPGVTGQYLPLDANGASGA